MKITNQKLIEIADILLDENMHYGNLFSATTNYKEMLFEASQLTLGQDDVDENIYTDSGNALGPKWASRCVDDIVRTRQFCMGVYKATLKKVLEKKGPVHIVYAGTGPFATLVLPLLTRFTSEEIKLTLLEINKVSLEGLFNVISFFEISDYIEAIDCCDATTYTIENPESVDIILTETLQKGLKEEPQVAISYNLMSQVSDQVILIPEDITLNLLLVDADKKTAHQTSFETHIEYYKNIGPLFSLNKTEISKHQDTLIPSLPNFTFPSTKILMPENANRDYHTLSIETQIRVFEDEVIKIDESGLTFLTKLTDLNAMLQTFNCVISSYQCSNKPGLQMKLDMC